jgi:hypothetical protein
MGLIRPQAEPDTDEVKAQIALLPEPDLQDQLIMNPRTSGLLQFGVRIGSFSLLFSLRFECF